MVDIVAGNPEGPNKPNKKKYDPRVWVREGEKTVSATPLLDVT